MKLFRYIYSTTYSSVNSGKEYGYNSEAKDVVVSNPGWEVGISEDLLVINGEKNV